eukprot:7532074-Alexandrium_andersonii.AAC.1
MFPRSRLLRRAHCTGLGAQFAVAPRTRLGRSLPLAWAGACTCDGPLHVSCNAGCSRASTPWAASHRHTATIALRTEQVSPC